jgi:pyruvate formate lyase activating enzyme
MKVTIFDIKRFAVHDGPGIRTTVFLKGCPLSCWWCHNPESQSGEPVTVDMERKVDGRIVAAKKTYGEEMDVDQLVEILLRDLPYFEESCGGITFSGGEPLMQAAPLERMLRMCRQKGLHTAVDTCGYASREAFDRVLGHTDLFLYDLKHMDQELHRTYTGVDNTLIIANADHLLRSGARVIFRIPVIPGINTSDEETERFLSFLEERKAMLEEVHLLPYHRIADSKYSRLSMKQRLPEVKEPGEKLLAHLKTKFESTGLQVSVGG